MASVCEILAIKGTHIEMVSPTASVYEAAVQMNRLKIGSLVVHDAGRLVGILTERDILQRIVAECRDAASTHVEDVMTTEVVCCRMNTSLEEARGVMKNRRIRHLPVLSEEGELLGVISIGDLNAHANHAHEQTIYLLQEYIAGHV
jgi:CBS domain-containing protein